MTNCQKISNELLQSQHPDNSQYDFSVTEWSSRYPKLAGTLPPDQIGFIAEKAVLIFNPTKTSIVCSKQERKIIFYTLVAHFVEIEKRIADGNLMIGFISNVSEGSVSIGMGNGGGMSKIPAFYAQTQYGLEYWQFILKYRTFRFKKPIPDRRNRLYP